MKRILGLILVLCLSGASSVTADIIVDYVVDRGGNNTEPLNGLSARGTFSIAGTNLVILLENPSAGVPLSFEASDSLVVSLGMNLPGVDILSGDAAVIGPGSVGLGAWSGRTQGNSVAEEWLWTNQFGGDLMEAFKHVISTSDGQGGGVTTRFDGKPGGVNGPFGGIAADPALISIPAKKPAVSDSIRFELTLTGGLSQPQLLSVASGSIVEFGSDQRYLGVPEPATVALVTVGPLLARRRR